MTQLLYAIFILLMLFSIQLFADETAPDIQAATPNGDKVILHANGRWEFIDVKKR